MFTRRVQHTWNNQILYRFQSNLSDKQLTRVHGMMRHYGAARRCGWERGAKKRRQNKVKTGLLRRLGIARCLRCGAIVLSGEREPWQLSNSSADAILFPPVKPLLTLSYSLLCLHYRRICFRLVRSFKFVIWKWMPTWMPSVVFLFLCFYCCFIIVWLSSSLIHAFTTNDVFCPACPHQLITATLLVCLPLNFFQHNFLLLGLCNICLQRIIGK